MSSDAPSLDVVCFGGAVVDRTYQVTDPLLAGTSNPASVRTAFGGVARNVAETLARLGHAVGMVSRVGDDEPGRALLGDLQAVGVRTDGCSPSSEYATAEYVAVLDPQGELAFGLAAMDAFDDLTSADFEDVRPLLRPTGWVFADCNLPAQTLSDLFDAKQGFHLALNTVSVAKTARLPDDLSAIDVLVTNLDEATALVGVDVPWEQAERILVRGVSAVVVTMGSDGYVVADASGVQHRTVNPAKVIDVTGAGDAMLAGTLHGLIRGHPLDVATAMGAKLAKQTLESPTAVRRDLSAATLA